jgi:simple sugar transport system permease protein
MGAFSAYAVAFYTGNLWLGVLAALAVGLMTGLLFALFTVTIKANQIVVGVAINLVGSGLSGFLFRSIFLNSDYSTLNIPTFNNINLPILSEIPFLGEIFFQTNVLVYLTVILVPLAAFVLYKTSFGLAVRSVGEHPKAADTMGISVSRVRYLCVVAGSMLAALGGASLTLAFANQFVEDMVSGRGFIALAAVVFGAWTPWGATGASLLFGAFYALQLRVQAMNNVLLPYQFLQVLPYVATVLALVSIRKRAQSPKALGVPYQA